MRFNYLKAGSFVTSEQSKGVSKRVLSGDFKAFDRGRECDDCFKSEESQMAFETALKKLQLGISN